MRGIRKAAGLGATARLANVATEYKADGQESQPETVRFGSKSVGLALGRELPLYPSEPTCGGTGSKAAMGQKRTNHSISLLA